MLNPQESSTPVIALLENEVGEVIRSGCLSGRFIESFNNAGLTEKSIRAFIRTKSASLRRELGRGQFAELIPRTYHRIWVTQPEFGHLPPLEYLETIAAEAVEGGLDFERIFWTNSKFLQAQLIRFFADRHATIEVRLICELNADDGLSTAFEKLVDARKYVLAADIAKIMVLRAMGGVYSDMGVSVKKPLAELVLRSELTLLFTEHFFFQLSFLAVPAHSKLMSLWAAVVARPEVLSSLVHPDQTEVSAIQEVELLAGPGFSIVVLLFSTDLDRVVFVPPRGHLIHWRSQRSWYPRSAKFGNISVEEAISTIVTRDRHLSLLARIKEDLAIAEKPSALEARTQILFALERHCHRVAE
jgi:hypothetical protein